MSCENISADNSISAFGELERFSRIDFDEININYKLVKNLQTWHPSINSKMNFDRFLWCGTYRHIIHYWICMNHRALKGLKILRISWYICYHWMSFDATHVASVISLRDCMSYKVRELYTTTFLSRFKLALICHTGFYQG